MKDTFKTVYEGGTGEIIVKKSRFIATVKPVDSEEEAIEFIENLKKKYWDASHNCSAYIIGTEQSIMRCSDDGEPSKTAGRPILDILTAYELTNTVIVVTRYFGGTLLGTGGLVKAYQEAAKAGLSNSIIIMKELGIKLLIITDYNYIGKIQYLIAQEKLPTLSSEYTDIVTLQILLNPVNKKSFLNKLKEATNGLARTQELEEGYYSVINNEIHLFY